jgi:hypothetical protein
VWHASVGGACAPNVRRRLAFEALRGVGLMTLQWEQNRSEAYHVRRRLTPEEQTLVGEAVDIRGTAEARERVQRALSLLPAAVIEFAYEEIQLP